MQGSAGDKKVFTVCWLNRNWLAVGGAHYIEIRNDQYTLVKSVSVVGLCVCIRPFPGNKIAALIHNKSKLFLLLYNSRLVYERTLIEIASAKWGHFSLNSSEIAMIDNSADQLKIFDFAGNYLRSIKMGGSLLGIQMLADSCHVVVTSYDNATISKYHLTLGVKWHCSTVKNPTGVCEGLTGELYAASHTEKCIYEISTTTGN